MVFDFGGYMYNIMFRYQYYSSQIQWLSNVVMSIICRC